MTRGYAQNSSVKLVGDRYRLTSRQRLAVARCACSDDQRRLRQSHRLLPAELSGRTMWIDGYNALTSIEAALGGGVILLARDRCHRDMSSMHGSYRKVAETVPAIELIGETLAQYGLSGCRWFLDQPVSNSGRLKTLLCEIADRKHWNWDVELVADPDPILSETDQIIASADSQILDAAQRWFNLARQVIDTKISEAWILNLSLDP